MKKSETIGKDHALTRRVRPKDEEGKAGALVPKQIAPATTH